MLVECWNPRRMFDLIADFAEARRVSDSSSDVRFNREMTTEDKAIKFVDCCPIESNIRRGIQPLTSLCKICD